MRKAENEVSLTPSKRRKEKRSNGAYEMRLS